MNKEIETTIDALKKNNFNVEYAEKAKDVADIALKQIPTDASIEFGGSTSVEQLRVLEKLETRGNKVPGFPEPGSTKAPKLTPSVRNDVLLVSTNAVTLDGKLINLDGMGNRVTGMVYGTKQVILVVGQNKIVKDIPAALDRVQEVIAPYHAANMGLKTPCTKTGKCEDCSSPDRICNIITIISKRPPSVDFTVILVGEDIGLGWDPDWPEDRIKKIRFNYRREWQRFAMRMGPPPSYKI